MSMLDTSIPAGVRAARYVLEPEDDPPMFPDDAPRPVRQGVYDGIVSRTRAEATPAAVEKRAVKRLSIGELNELDLDGVMQRMRVAPYDSRGPVTRFLDLLDMPRNTLATTAFPSIERRKRAAGETGTFGRGVVRFSDILDEMGVKPGLIRGVVGFLGDVATDPLTYLGPAGYGARLVSKSGRALEATAAGRRAIERSIGEVASGSLVANKAHARLFKVMGVDAMRAAGKSADDIVSELKGVLYGDVKNRVRDRLGRGVLGFDMRGEGGLLANSLERAAVAGADDAELILAARDVAKEMSRATAPGIRIGRNAAGRMGVQVARQGEEGIAAGSYLFHVPFTSYGLYVPAFTEAAQVAASRLAFAKAGLSQPVDNARVKELERIAGEINASRGRIEEHMKVVAGRGDSPDSIEDAIRAEREIQAGLVNQARSAFEAAAEEADSVADLLWLNDKLAEVEANNEIALGVFNASKDERKRRNEILGVLENEGLSREVIAKRMFGPNRARVMAEMKEAFGDEGASFAPVMDAYARGWASSRGVSPDDYYAGLRVVKGGEPGTVALMQEAEKNAPIWYSKLSQVVGEKMGGAADADQLRAMLVNNGVKPEEIEWSRIGELKGRVTKEQVIEHLADNAVTVEEKTLPDRRPVRVGDLLKVQGGYDEVTRILPTGLVETRDGRILEADDATSMLKNTDAHPRFSQYVLPGGSDYRELLLRLPDGRSNFTGGHYPEPNVLAHIRFNTRTDAQGKRVLFIEEIQSDWHQKGREKGYAPFGDHRERMAEIDKEITKLGDVRDMAERIFVRNRDESEESAQMLRPVVKQMMANALRIPAPEQLKSSSLLEWLRRYNDAAERQDALRAEWNLLNSAIPNAPFKKTWHELAMKRMIRYAAENGYDRIAWTTGAQQAERYDLSKQVSAILAKKNDDGTWKIGVRPNRTPAVGEDSGTFLTEIGGRDLSKVPESELPDVVGKDLADKIVARSGKPNLYDAHLYDGVDLRVGGEGMSGFYDKMLVTDTNKLIKKHGGRVGEVGIELPGSFADEENVFMPGDRLVVPGFDITPSMKQDALGRGMPLFQQGRGSYEAAESGQRIIRALTDPNASTLPHEVAHDFLAQLPFMDAQLAERAARALGAESHAAIGVEHQEQFARGFEAYLRDGNAPTPRLREVFEKFKKWLLDIYHSIVGTPLEGRLNPKLRDIFDEMLKRGGDDIANMTPDELRIREAVTDSLGNEMKARASIAQAIRGTIAATGASKNRELADAAMRLAGHDPDIMGYSAFMPIRTAIRAVFGDNSVATQMMTRPLDTFESQLRKTFGWHDGALAEQRRFFQVGAYDSARRAMNQTQAEVGNKIYEILDAAGIGRDKADLALSVVVALGHQRRAAMFENAVENGGPALVRALDDAKKAGLGKVFDDLARVAEDHKELFDDMSEIESAENVLGTIREGYSPDRLTVEGREFLKSARGPSTGGPSGRALEFFQKPKATNRATYVNDAGVTKNLYQFEYNFAKSLMGPHLEDNLMAFRAQSPKVESWAKELIHRAQEYDALPEQVKRTTASWRQVDPFTKNDDIQRLGMLSPGLHMPRGYFETNAAELLSQRFASSERARIREMWEAITAQWAKPIHSNLLENATHSPDGARIVFHDGSVGSIAKGRGGQHYVVLNGERYRKLNGAADIEHAVERLGAGFIDKKNMSVLYPERVAETIERVSEVINDPHYLIDALDQFLKVWKITTLSHPSWVIGDVIGGLIQVLASGVNPIRYIKNIPTAVALAFRANNPEALRKMTVTIQGRKMTGEEAVIAADGLRVLIGSIFGEPFVKLMEHGVFTPKYTEPLRPTVGSVGQRMRDLNSFFGRKAQYWADAKGLGSNKYVVNLAKTKGLVVDGVVKDHIISPFFAFNAHANDSLRLALWFTLMDEGNSAEGAARKVVEALFDTADLTHTEQTWMKRVLPFYAWLKNSGLYAVRALALDPKYISMPRRVQEAVEESLYGDNVVPPHLRPQWMRDQLALQIGSNPNTRYALTLGTLVPQEMGLNVGSALASPALGIESLKPLIENAVFATSLPAKLAYELGTGREAFSGRSISFAPHEGDLSVGEYLASQVRPLREMGVGNVRRGPLVKAAESGAGALAARVALAGRAQPFDDERVRANRVREYREAEAAIRKRITVAEREGASEESLAARARLMALYDRMMSSGDEGVVPKWAREQLAGAR